MVEILNMFSKIRLQELIEHPKTRRSIISAIKADRNYPFEVGGDVSYRIDGETKWLYFRQVQHGDLHLLDYLNHLEDGIIIPEEMEALKENARELGGISSYSKHWKETLEKLEGIDDSIQEQKSEACRSYRDSCKYYYRRDASVPRSPRRIGKMHLHEGIDFPSDGDINIVKTRQTPEFIVCHGTPDIDFVAEINPEKPHPLSRYCVIVVQYVFGDGKLVDVIQNRFGDYFTGEGHEELAKYPFTPFLRIPTEEELEIKYGGPVIHFGQPKKFKGRFTGVERF